MTALMGAAGEEGGAAAPTSGSSSSTTSGITKQAGRGRSTSNTNATSAAKSNQAEGESSEEDASTTEAPAELPGVYGGEYQLQIDIGRIPRPDEFAGTIEGGYIPASDVRTVNYYITAPGTVAAPEGGLVRSEMNRAEAIYMWAQGDPSQLEQRAALLAAEVAGIRFAYFDGMEFFPEWDTTAMGGLPVAVEIELTLLDPVTKQVVGVNGMPRRRLGLSDARALAQRRPVRSRRLWSGSSPGEDGSSDSTGQENSSSGHGERLGRRNWQRAEVGVAAREVDGEIETTIARSRKGRDAAAARGIVLVVVLVVIVMLSLAAYTFAELMLTEFRAAGQFAPASAGHYRFGRGVPARLPGTIARSGAAKRRPIQQCADSPGSVARRWAGSARPRTVHGDLAQHRKRRTERRAIWRAG